MKIRAFLTLTTGLLLTVTLFGQDRAAIRGTITDPSGAVVAGAHVELKSPHTGLTRESVTGGAGIYEFDSLPVGSYQLTIAQNGFRQVTVGEIAHIAQQHGRTLACRKISNHFFEKRWNWFGSSCPC